MKRLFIETDFLKEDELRSAQRTVRWVLEANGLESADNVFDETVDFAWQNADKAWEAVKRCDEIYGDSSLVPLCGYGTYTGAPVIMDVMMQKAIDENIEGKSVIFLRKYEDIEWDGIDKKLLAKAFKKNKLFTTEPDEKWDDHFIEVDIKKLIKELK